jgi:nucleotide-binding universal stress UspA family protein
MKILLATDGSEYSERAARFLRCLDFSPEDEITVFHAVSWIPFLYDKESYFNTLKEIKKDISPRILDSALDILKPVRAKISTAIVEGAAEQSIREAAEESGTELIVMGARGIKGIKSLLIGSVTKFVAMHSHSPVLVVKGPTCRESERMKILFATDGSDYCNAAGEFLSEIPFPVDAELTILNVVWSDFSDIPERFVMEINERIKDIVAKKRSEEFSDSERILEHARILLSKRFRNIHLLTRVGDPSAEILKTAEAIDAHMTAVGCRGLSGMKGLMGSVSRNIVTHAKSSVLIGKACKG